MTAGEGDGWIVLLAAAVTGHSAVTACPEEGWGDARGAGRQSGRPDEKVGGSRRLVGRLDFGVETWSW